MPKHTCSVDFKRLTLLVATTLISYSDLETDPACVSYHNLVRSFLFTHGQKYYIKLACAAENLLYLLKLLLSYSCDKFNRLDIKQQIYKGVPHSDILAL